MSSASSSTRPTWYWIVSTLATLWMIFGVTAWTIDLVTNETTLETISEAQRTLFAARPDWVFIVYGIAVFSGLVGTIALLLKKTWAVPALAVSLAAAVLQFSYTLFVMDAIRLLGPALALPFPIVIIVIGILLLWLAHHARKRRWIG